ncbi:hypothetical protein B0H11DRAFT_2233489 [Mycena galericulata]|nr:hypothetical protein B0H11DRAFT_2233489 [Mycena galericulata]
MDEASPVKIASGKSLLALSFGGGWMRLGHLLNTKIHAAICAVMPTGPCSGSSVPVCSAQDINVLIVGVSKGTILRFTYYCPILIQELSTDASFRLHTPAHEGYNIGFTDGEGIETQRLARCAEVEEAVETRICGEERGEKDFIYYFMAVLHLAMSLQAAIDQGHDALPY